MRIREEATPEKPYAGARIFRVGRCARRYHSIVVGAGLRFSFGFILTDAKAKELLGRAVRTWK